MIDASKIQEHMEVVGSDDKHVGTVDNVGIKIIKKYADDLDLHHYLKLEMIASVQGNKLVLSVPSAEAIDELKAVEN